MGDMSQCHNVTRLLKMEDRKPRSSLHNGWYVTRPLAVAGRSEGQSQLPVDTYHKYIITLH
jgi:hypothetical protein